MLFGPTLDVSAWGVATLLLFCHKLLKRSMLNYTECALVLKNLKIIFKKNCTCRKYNVNRIKDHSVLRNIGIKV